MIRRNDISSYNESIVLKIRLATINFSLPVYIDPLVKGRINLMKFVQVLTCSYLTLITKSHKLPSLQETSMLDLKIVGLKTLLTARGL